ncbi:hypothetical protein BH20ACT14_BH20ACT14_10560 [soil metagenome]
MVARLVGATLVLLFVSAVAVYGVFGADICSWGCPSQAEIAEPWSRDEVQSAFARTGLDLVRIEWPPELRTARSYRGAAVFRHAGPGAVLHVLVCAARCDLPRFQIRPGRPRVQLRFGFGLGTNVVGWISGPDHAAAAGLRHALSEPLDELNRNPDADSRCYIG